MKSAFLRLNLSDILKGLVVAILAAGLSFISTSLQSNGLSLDIQELLRVSLIAATSYLAKQLITDSDGRVLGRIG